MNRISLLLILLVFSLTSFGQSLKGKILSGKNIPLSDAYILNLSNDTHGHSNESGQFSLEAVTVGDTLRFHHLGYQREEVILKATDFNKNFEITLIEIPLELTQVTINSNAKSVKQISKIDLSTNPVKSSQEILRQVPGLIIGQHAGGGKAEQIFLRGFDIDHGTDINLTVDGMPVNMVSHAHGQGYADLHFLIPETIESIDFGKGPYYADKGNFTTAGYVDFRTKNYLDQSQFTLEYGQFNTLRAVGLFDLLDGSKNQHAYLASEYVLTDGPYNSPQHFNRFNLMGKYTAFNHKGNKLSMQASYFQSKWDASGQIPQRAIDAGQINRFGAIDDTEGGNTSRTNISVEHTKLIDQHTFLKSQAYLVNYNFELYSNFTFFLNDPVNGDQIRQLENRNIIGFQSVLNKEISLGVNNLALRGGIGLRYDDVNNNELSRTLNRKAVLEPIALGNVDESNIYSFVDARFELGKWLVNPSVRFDYFKFDYVNQLEEAYLTASEQKAMASPKLNILYTPNPNWQFYASSGLGFHSNDTRVVVAQNGKEILPTAFGTDLGTIWKPTPQLFINTALWYLFLEQEFVYVGDEGVVEPSGKTRRLGVDLGLRYQIMNYLFFDADINYAYARSINEPEEQDYIPLAPDLTTTGGISFLHPNGLAGGIRYRYIKNRPANEDNSIIAKGYFVTDMNIRYSRKNWNIGVNIENLFNTIWNETQFATESRLANETTSFEEIHFTPGTPFFAKASIGFTF